MSGLKGLALDTQKRMARSIFGVPRPVLSRRGAGGPALALRSWSPFYFLRLFCLPPALSPKLLEAARTSGHYSD